MDERKLRFAGEVTARRVSAKYQEGLADQAARLVTFTDAVLSETEQELGLTVGGRLELLALAVERRPSSYRVKLRGTGAAYRAAVFLTPQDAAGETPPEPYLHDLFIIVHELVETTLVDARPRRAFNDFWYGPYRVRNYTRWFRDGYANYAAYVAMQAARRRLGDRWPAGLSEAEGIRAGPFSSLKRFGFSLFRWDQFSNIRPSLLGLRLSIVYDEGTNERYAAATGLFLLIERRFGREAIRRITDEAAKLDYPDGDALVFTCNRVLGTDVRRLHETLAWPDLGLRMHQANLAGRGTGVVVESVQPGELADRAGVEPNDLITSVNGRPIRDLTEFELALYDGPHREAAEIVVRHVPWNERPPVTLRIPLGPRDPPARDRR